MSLQTQTTILRSRTGIITLQRVPSQGNIGRHCLKKGRGVPNMVKFAALSRHDTSGRSYLRCTVLLGNAWSFLHGTTAGRWLSCTKTLPAMCWAPSVRAMMVMEIRWLYALPLSLEQQQKEWVCNRLFLPFLTDFSSQCNHSGCSAPPD